ncbi:polysaccharide deacetylase [Mariannaea sp. PMI_226]|nr:polysaccharide deacetylase [Mariannaea sp. PMI_226]
MLSQSLIVALAAGAVASPMFTHHQRRQAIPFGNVITKCTQKGVIALTFDDGPFEYTDEILDHLADAGMKATFFVNGNNWASIYDYQSTVKRMISDGHQVASHSMTHPDLTTLDYSGIESEMTQLEGALLDIIGKFSTYMRHPFFSFNEQTLSVMADLDYHVVHASIDTQDWQHDAPDAINQSLDIFQNDLDEGGSICLMHDVHENTATKLVPEIISIVKDRGLRAVTVGQCLGDPEENWYRTSRGSSGASSGSSSSKSSSFLANSSKAPTRDDQRGINRGKF